MTLLKRQSGGLLDTRLKGAMLNYGKPLASAVGTTPTPAPKTRGDKIHDTLSDVATNVATVGTSFRKATPEELDLGRGGWAGRAKLLGGATAKGALNAVGVSGAARLMGMKGAGILAKGLKWADRGLNAGDVVGAATPYLQGGGSIPPAAGKELSFDQGQVQHLTDISNEQRLKDMMKEPLFMRAAMTSYGRKGTLGGLMDNTMTTKSPDRMLPAVTDPNVAKVKDFIGGITQPELSALLNTKANPFGKRGWIKNVVMNPEVDITMDKVKKAGSAVRGLYNLKKEGYKFEDGGKV